ncbi:MAG: glycosyltransferase family 2 protein [Pseudomonadota bacterium]
MHPLLSIVIPCYNEEAVLDEAWKRLCALRNQLENMRVEFIFVNDGSKDKTHEKLLNLQEFDADIRVLKFARNFGHQIAVTAGIDAASGDAVVLIDADLQDPPEIILEMIQLWRNGYQVVYGTRVDRPGESFFKLITARLFYRILNQLSDIPIPLDTGDFRLMDRKIIEVMKAMPEHDRFVRGLVSWVGFKQVALPYRREKRFAGESKYPLAKMIRFATDGLFSFSSKPLQLATKFGLLTSCIAFLGIINTFIVRLTTDNWVPGWAEIMTATLFIGGVQLICVGILGEYVGRIYTEVKKRPLYVVQDKIGFENKEE